MRIFVSASRLSCISRKNPSSFVLRVWLSALRVGMAVLPVGRSGEGAQCVSGDKHRRATAWSSETGVCMSYRAPVRAPVHTRLDEVLEIGATRSARLPEPESTSSLFGKLSENEKLTHDFVKQWWWKTRYERQGKTDDAERFKEYVTASHDKVFRAMVKKMWPKVIQFPDVESCEIVTQKLVDQEWRIVPWGQMNPRRSRALPKRYGPS